MRELPPEGEAAPPAPRADRGRHGGRPPGARVGRRGVCGQGRGELIWSGDFRPLDGARAALRNGAYTNFPDTTNSGGSPMLCMSHKLLGEALLPCLV